MITTSAVDVLWLDTLHRICGRAAHELNGVLNGVSVNLEVVRTRAARPDMSVSSIAPFANSAATQFDAVMDMSEGLLALAREGKGPIDLGATTRRIEALLGPAARADGRSLMIDGSLEELGSTSAPASAARLAIGASLLAAMDASESVTCRAAGHRLVIECGDGGAPGALGEDIVSALKDAEIEIQTERSVISISFPG